MTETRGKMGGAPGAGPAVCPFVALVEDRDRRADGPDARNRCYAEPAPRQRPLAYQADYCYAPTFSTCAAFLDWAARNAAEPTYPVPSPPAGSTGEARHGLPGVSGMAGVAGVAGARAADVAASPPPPGDVTMPVLAMDDASGGPAAPRGGSPSETLDWVSASAWAAVPPGSAYEEEEEEDADDAVGDEASEATDPDTGARDEPTTAPRVPAALPLRRRRRPQEPIRTRGSGEWFYGEPVAREPLVRRRFAVAPPVALGALGLLVVALVVLLVPSLLSGGGRSPGVAGGPSPSPGASVRRVTTPRPSLAPPPSVAPATPEPSPQRRTYRVRAGDSLSAIASRFGVPVGVLQCRNLIRNPNLIPVGQVLTIPPEGYTCPPGWRRATPTPEPAEAEPEAEGSVPAE